MEHRDDADDDDHDDDVDEGDDDDNVSVCMRLTTCQSIVLCEHYADLSK